MDFEKINYDLIEAVIEYILEGPDFPKKGSILVFLPGLQEIMTLYDQICKNPRYVIYYSRSLMDKIRQNSAILGASGAVLA